MTSLVTQGNASGSGSITLATPNTNSNQTLTLPDETGTLLSTGSAVRTQKGVPAFRASKSGTSQSITSSVWTKVSLPNEIFDVTGAFDSVTNHRFQPAVAGYYLMTSAVSSETSTGVSRLLGAICVNGIEVSRHGDIGTSSFNGYLAVTGSSIIYLNGSTDYAELYAYITATTPVIQGGQSSTYLSGILIAAA